MSSAKVYAAINAVQADLAKIGISKDQKNLQQGFMFRGIDAVYNALSPLLAKHKLVILPEVLSREVVERQTARGGALFYTVLMVRYHFVSAEDGSAHIVVTYGEAMDSGDKATNKAMSAAYKYACFQAFAIPTEGDNDADSTTHEVAPPKKSAAITKKLKACKSLDELIEIWKGLTSEQRAAHEQIKDEMKQKLTEVAHEAG
jgi:hypothetical protein